MIRKIGITIVTTLIAVFGFGHLCALVTNGQFGCAAAAAQRSWADGGGDSESEEVSTEPEKKPTPPDFAGDYAGEGDDDDIGPFTIVANIDQHANWNLSGTWGSGFGGTTFKGSIKYIDGDWVLKLIMKIKGGCHLKAVGMPAAPDDAVGMPVASGQQLSFTYDVESCKGYKGDKGSFMIND